VADTTTSEGSGPREAPGEAQTQKPVVLPVFHAEPASPAAAIPPALADHPRYRLVRLLGQGGMGAVYLAEHRHMERPVALKVISPDLVGHPAAVRRFKQEVTAAARLGPHPNVVTVFDADHKGRSHAADALAALDRLRRAG